ncbi:MAG: hypothetical protein LPK25_00490 [Cyclobacteriaceae bacterium]|nr:hypothetical protein [Cyclobacteriaceae bacterium]
MKKYSNLLGKISLALALGMAFGACSNEEDQTITDPQTQARLSTTATGSSQAGSENGRVVVGGMTVSNFYVGTQTVEMRYFAKADLLADISLGNLQLKSNTSAGLQTSSSSQKTHALITSGNAQFSVVGEGSTPEGNYREVSFKLFKNTSGNANDPMYQKSLAITGEVNGKITTFWTESEKVIRAASESSTGVQVDNNTEMVLVFELEKLFAGVDFSTALDANLDGRIDISPNSPDGNQAIFSRIESNLESAVSLKNRESVK